MAKLFVLYTIAALCIVATTIALPLNDGFYVKDQSGSLLDRVRRDYAPVGIVTPISYPSGRAAPYGTYGSYGSRIPTNREQTVVVNVPNEMSRYGSSYPESNTMVVVSVPETQGYGGYSGARYG